MPLFNLFTLNILISSQQQSWALTLAVWIILGLIFGFIGSKIFNLTGYGLGRDCLLGVAGASIGGVLAYLAGKFSGLDLGGLQRICSDPGRCGVHAPLSRTA